MTTIKLSTPEQREEFKLRFGDTHNVIRVGFNLTQLYGVGTEYLVGPGGIILAKFYDGDLVSGVVSPKGSEKTLITK